ncbi:MAG TPA: very short patch repair endonuclease [Capillimicrobium sp.]
MDPAHADYPHPTSAAVTASMKGNRRADTRPELALRSALHARGLRFRKDLMIRTADGTRTKADIVFTRARVAVFVDGCFWHGCPDHGTKPKANAHYWGPKLAKNRERDARVTAALAADGWTVVRLWEHVAVGDGVEQVAAAVARAAQ